MLADAAPPQPVGPGHTGSAVTALDWARALVWLGAPSLLAYAVHRARLATGVAARALPDQPMPQGPHLAGALPAPAPPTLPEAARDRVLATASALAQGRVTLFGGIAAMVGSPPDWHRDPLTGETSPGAERPALSLDLFDRPDIRPLWELGRGGWALVLAAACRITGDAAQARLLETWLDSFLAANPPYRGPHWACGQEAGLRLLHLAAAASVLGTERSQHLAVLLGLHLRRLEATSAYARAQANNHRLSEACARFVGGALAGCRRSERAGRQGIEACARLLFTEAGSFAQASSRYQRMALDLLSAAEWWRIRLGRPAFDRRVRERALACLGQLSVLADAGTGRLPRIGHDDGTALFAMGPEEVDDARPSLARAAAAWGRRALPADPLVFWLGLGGAAGVPGGVADPVAGFALRREGAWLAVLRGVPRRFRLAHADLLHLELRASGGGPNLADPGTYLYNPGSRRRSLLRLLPGTASHNTIGFDDEDQAPRLGRFLFGAPPAGPAVRLGPHLLEAAYRDHRGRSHRRLVQLERDRVVVEDRIDGPWREAVLRWRLEPGWGATERGAACPSFRVAVEGDRTLGRALVPGLEAPGYGRLHPVPVLETRLSGGGAARLVTTIERIP